MRFTTNTVFIVFIVCGAGKQQKENLDVYNTSAQLVSNHLLPLLPLLPTFNQGGFVGFYLMSESLQESLKGGFEFVLVKNVTNMQQLVDKLRKGDVDAGLVNPALIMSKVHLQAAGNVADCNLRRGKLVTTNVNSEYVFALSPSRTISQAYTTFGPTAKCTEVVFGAYFAESSLSNAKALEAYVQTLVSGDIVPVEEVSQFADAAKIRKVCVFCIQK